MFSGSVKYEVVRRIFFFFWYCIFSFNVEECTKGSINTSILIVRINWSHCHTIIINHQSFRYINVLSILSASSSFPSVNINNFNERFC